MDTDRCTLALDRIAAAAARIEAAAARAPATGGAHDEGLIRRHAALKQAVEATLDELDGLIGEPE